MAVIGGGITGAIVAWHLAEAGYDVVVLERRHIAMGSTAASTASLQYELDATLVNLAEKIGEKAAIQCYLLCEKAVHQVRDLCVQAGAADLYQDTGSFQFASFKKDTGLLMREFRFRQDVGLDVEWMDAPQIKRRYGFDKSGGIFSKTGAAIDAYALTHCLLRSAAQKSLRVFDHTSISRIEHLPKGVRLHTMGNRTVSAGKLVIAAGYESEHFLPFKVQQLYSTFAIASEPLMIKECWYQNSLLWETADPYLYIRMTNDNRVLVGGKDTPGGDAGKRHRALPAKVKQLENSFGKLFPGIPFKTDFAWAGTFGTTKNSLPYFGCTDCPHSYFVIGLGGNGIPFAMVAADLVKDWLRGKENSNAPLFSFTNASR